MPTPPYRAVVPNEQQDQGDPFFVRIIDSNRYLAWYMYHTGQNEDGGVFAYRSYNFVDWEPLGTVFRSDPTRSHWAPCVRYMPELKAQGLKPCRALVSRGKGHGRYDHVGHNLELWTSDHMEGPFEFDRAITNLDFAIDAEVWRDPYTDALMLGYARNFYEDGRTGTGVVITLIHEDLTALKDGGESLCIRGSQPWQIFERDRIFFAEDSLVIPERYWNDSHTEARMPVWYCIEGLAAGYVNKHRQPCYFYSAGRFGSDIPGLEYSVGLYIQTSPGAYQDVTAKHGFFPLRSKPDLGLYDPGHGSLVQGPRDEWYFGCHARPSPSAPRQAYLFRVFENKQGWPYCKVDA